MTTVRGGDGFAYLSLLILVAVLSTTALATMQLGSVVQRRAAEEELLAIGTEYRNALFSYAAATPAGQPRAPRRLEDLLKDPRHPGVLRHLRKVYVDPMTGRAEWGVVEAAGGGGIVGIYSLSEARPLKVGNFPREYFAFTSVSTYREWLFTTNVGKQEVSDER